MHNKFPKIFYFIDKFNKDDIKNLDKSIGIIYRNYKNEYSLDLVKKIKKICGYYGNKIYIANNLKLAQKIKKGKFPLLGNGKAISLGNSDGFVKTIFNAETGELIGAHMIGPEVTELISTYSIAMQLEATELDLINTIFPHPTVSESIHESVLDAYDRALHI